MSAPVDRILDRDAALAVNRGSRDHRLDHGAVGRGGAEHQVRHDAIERGAGRHAALLALERRVDAEPHRLQDRRRDLGKQAAAHLVAAEAGEKRRLQALDAHRHHHRVGLVGDQAGAVIDLHQAAGDGDAAFRKDDQRLAALTALISVRVAIGLVGSSGIGAGELQERLHPPALRDRAVDGEHRLAIRGTTAPPRRRGSSHD